MTKKLPLCACSACDFGWLQGTVEAEIQAALAATKQRKVVEEQCSLLAHQADDLRRDVNAAAAGALDGEEGPRLFLS